MHQHQLKASFSPNNGNLSIVNVEVKNVQVWVEKLGSRWRIENHVISKTTRLYRDDYEEIGALFWIHIFFLISNIGVIYIGPVIDDYCSSSGDIPDCSIHTYICHWHYWNRASIYCAFRKHFALGMQTFWLWQELKDLQFVSVCLILDTKKISIFINLKSQADIEQTLSGIKTF